MNGACGDAAIGAHSHANTKLFCGLWCAVSPLAPTMHAARSVARVAAVRSASPCAARSRPKSTPALLPTRRAISAAASNPAPSHAHTHAATTQTAARTGSRAQSTAAAANASGASTFEKLFFDAPEQNSLDETFPGVPAISGHVDAPTKVQVSKLQNGLTVVSQDSHHGVRAHFWRDSGALAR